MSQLFELQKQINTTMLRGVCLLHFANATQVRIMNEAYAGVIVNVGEEQEELTYAGFKDFLQEKAGVAPCDVQGVLLKAQEPKRMKDDVDDDCDG